MKRLVLFNNKGGVGKTTLTFNIAHMMARQGLHTLLIDCDPQCNLSALVLSEEKLFELWESSSTPGRTAATCIDLVRRGKGDVIDPELVTVTDDLWLLPGDLALSRFEQTLAEQWGKVLGTDSERALDVTTSLNTLANKAAEKIGADVVLMDLGPSLGALNRAALLACDGVIVPLAPDLFSLQGLKNIGPTFREWREEWRRVLAYQRVEDLPRNMFKPIGYIVQQHLARADRPVAGYELWASKIPPTYHAYVLDTPETGQGLTIDADPNNLGFLKHFASLVPLAQQARKPLFDLKRADGVGGGQIQAVAKARKEFEELVSDLRERLESVAG